MGFFTTKKKRGREYLYFEEREWVNGKPKRTYQKYLGPRENFPKELTKNSSPLKLQELKIDPCPFGLSAALWQMAQDLDLVEIIDRYFVIKDSAPASIGQYLVIAAINRVVDPCSKSQLADWFQKDWLSKLLPINPDLFNAQTYWRQFQLLTPEIIDKIQCDICKQITEKYELSWDHLLYDTTNFFSFSKHYSDTGIRQTGHCKENRFGLPLVNYFLVCSKPWGIPLFYESYAGNIPDVEKFKEMPSKITAHLKRLEQDPKQITLAFDKGNLSSEAFKEIDKQHLKFIASLRPSTQKDLLHVPRDQFSPITLPHSQKKVEYYRTSRIIYGKDRIVFVVIDPSKVIKDQFKFDEKLHAKQEEINQFIQEQLNIKMWRDPDRVKTKITSLIGKNPWKSIMIPEIFGDNGALQVTISIDMDAKATYLETLGRFFLFTNHEEWAPSEVIWAYREQYLIEQTFKLMKDPNSIAVRPMYHWAEKSIEGHIFTCILSYLLLAMLRFFLARKGASISYPTILRQLRSLYVNRIEIPSTKEYIWKLAEYKDYIRKYLAILKLESLIPHGKK
jgi:transposase